MMDIQEMKQNVINGCWTISDTLAILDDLARLTALTQWIPVREIKKTHSANRVIIHMANDFIVIATYYKQHDSNGFFRNDNGSIVAYDDVIEFCQIPKIQKVE